MCQLCQDQPPAFSSECLVKSKQWQQQNMTVLKDSHCSICIYLRKLWVVDAYNMVSHTAYLADRSNFMMSALRASVASAADSAQSLLQTAAEKHLPAPRHVLLLHPAGLGRHASPAVPPCLSCPHANLNGQQLSLRLQQQP